MINVRNLEAFAHEFESMFNGFRDPVEKQMVVEFFCVVAIVLKRHPELRLNKASKISVLMPCLKFSLTCIV